MSKQPVSGILATLLVMAVSLGFISLFSFGTFSGWVSFALMCTIPMQIVVGVLWHTKHPAAAQRPQPGKGVMLSLLTVVVGIVVLFAYFYLPGGGVSPPAPMLIMCTITSVIVTFWWTIMMGGWPFTAMMKNPVASGLSVLAGCYILNYLLFRVFFNYDFMRGAPVYVPSLDPHGLFNAWYSTVFYVTFSAVMFLLVHFDLWPISKSPSLMKQPVLGIVFTVTVFVLTVPLFYLGMGVLKMDIANFMVKVPVPFIFGTIVVQNMLHGSLFAKRSQPVKGVLNTIAAIIVGEALAGFYGVASAYVTAKLPPGPPGYEFEIWVASALLAVTFPFLIFYAEFFQMWPIIKVKPE